MVATEQVQVMEKKRSYNGNHSPGAIARKKSYRVRTRARAIAAMGGVCARCGYSDARALQFDHKKPVRRGLNGLSKRAETGRDTWLKVLSGRKADYELLCANCHAIKG